MTIQNMDICLNVSSGPAASATKKVQRSKAAFFKPQVKRLARKLKHDKREKNENAKNEESSKDAKSPKNTRIRQKSLAAIVAKNLARSRSVTFDKNLPTKKVQSHAITSTSMKKGASPEGGSTYEKPAVSFSEPTKDNALKTILVRTRSSNAAEPKKSLADIFSKGSTTETHTKLLPESSQDRRVETPKPTRFGAKPKAETGHRRFQDGKNRQDGNPERIAKHFDDNREKTPYSKPSGKISSLFGNNPEVPNIGQRLVKPVNESVFGETTFTDLGVHPFGVSNLSQNMGIERTTNVQQKAIPVILSGRNVLVRSQTGSGKTLAYAVPIVERLQRIRPKLTRACGLKALVVVPTRELALQTYECFLKLVKPFSWIVSGYLVGGEKRKAEKARLRRGCSILVATPGRLLDHIEHTEALRLGDVECFVLDEADRMLDMGYEKDISGIVDALKKQSDAATEKSSYDPLALVRSRATVDESQQRRREEEEREAVIISASEDNPHPEDCQGSSTKQDEDSDDSDHEVTPDKPEYHSGTDSDDDESLIRTKRKKDSLCSKKQEKEVVVQQSTEDGFNDASKPSRQTILLSATLTAAVEKLAGLAMSDPVLVDAAKDNLSQAGASLDQSNEDLVVPQGVSQTYIVTPAKLRMVTLSAYIAGKCQTAGQHKILVFMATQDMIDYHADILSTVLGKPTDEDDEDSEPLVDVEFFKLHGSMSQKERTEVFKTFRKARSGVLLCTDVAARGLDMPKVDTVIQYTGPLSARDYVHRIGRTGRAGTSGASAIFLTPSEIDFVRLLESRRIRIKQESMEDVLDKLVGPLSRHRSVEATATALQNQFETLVLENKNFHGKACKAYVSWVRFYASYPRDMREVFNRKDLHLGHYAKSFALRDPPQKIGGIGKTLRDKESIKTQHNNRLTYERAPKELKKRQRTNDSGKKTSGLLKRSRMLNVSEYGSGLETIKKGKK